jgi:hypothetical protein
VIIGCACSRHGEDEKCIQNFERDYYGGVIMNGSKRSLKTIDQDTGRDDVDLFHKLRQVLAAGGGELSSEPSIYLKHGDFFFSLETMSFSGTTVL